MTEERSGVTDVGRPKKGAKRESSADDRVAIIHLKGSEAYFKWLEEVHNRTHIPKTTIIRLALIDWAAKNGHPKPPEF